MNHVDCAVLGCLAETAPRSWVRRSRLQVDDGVDRVRGLRPPHSDSGEQCQLQPSWRS